MTQLDERDIERRLAHFAHVCREAGLKLTHQRTEIYREVARTGDHPDAETIFERIRERLPSVSLDTVYRTLHLLGDLGLVDMIEPAVKRTRFDANLTHHHHYVCIRCGMTRDFYSDELDALTLPAAAKLFGDIKTTRVEVRGVCIDCARRDTPEGSTVHDREGS